MTNSFELTEQERSDRQFYEAILGCWEYSIAGAYRQALRQTGDDELAQERVIRVLESRFAGEAVPPTFNALIEDLECAKRHGLRAVS